MSENRTIRVRRGAWSAGAAVAVTIGLLSAGAADADTFISLPDGQKLGPGVTLTRTDEHAVISPSLVANGVGRVVWVSGNARADVRVTPEGEVGLWNGPTGRPGSDNSSTHGASQLNTGYIVGCQVSVGDDALRAGLQGLVTTDGPGVAGAIGLDLGPGEVAFVQIGAKDILKPGVYSVEYQDTEIEIQGCAGYAQARSYSVVEIIGDYYSKTTLYGQPFSIG
ncbi:MspA family porin [Nocardia sp. NPDC057663]|uniref:MspA family porin n=1 Tax=Nocardia sp. NPDC057663 TaxID=3346201 RepID=UPI00366ADB72